MPGIFRVSALERTTAPIEHRTGSQPSDDHLAPGLTSWEPIVLERGRTHDTAFEDWANLVWSDAGGISLATFRKDIRIELLDEQGTTVTAFNAHRAWRFEDVALSQLDADDVGAAVESLTLQHEGLTRDPKETSPAARGSSGR